MSIKKNISITFISQIIIAGIGFILSVFIARLLGAEGRGAYALYQNSVQLAGVWLGFSLSSTIIYFTQQGEMNTSRLLGNAIILLLLSTLLSMTVLLVLYLYDHHNIIYSDSRYFFIVALIFGLHFFFSQNTALWNAYLNAKGFFTFASMANIITLTLHLLFAIILYFIISSKNPLLTLLIGNLIIYILQSIVLFLYSIHKTNIRPQFAILPTVFLYKIIIFGGLAYLCNAIQFLSYRLDIWILDHYHSSKLTGIYALTVSLAQMVWLIPQSIATVFYAQASGKDISFIKDFMYKYTPLAVYSCILLGVMASMFFMLFASILFGNEFIEIGPYILVLLLGLIPFSIVIMAGSFFAAMGKVNINLFIAIIAFIIVLVLDLLWIPIYGIWGAIAATIISYLASVIGAIYYLFKYKLNLIELFNLSKAIELINIWTR